MCVKTIFVILGSNTVGSPGMAGVRLKRNALTEDYFFVVMELRLANLIKKN